MPKRLVFKGTQKDTYPHCVSLKETWGIEPTVGGQSGEAANLLLLIRLDRSY